MKSFAVLLAVALYWQANLVASQDDPIEYKGVASGEAPASVRTIINLSIHPGYYLDPGCTTS